MHTAADLAALIRGEGPCLVLTGAGMSTESGIPDFRSAAGIWAEVDPYEVASIDAFHADPLRVWRWYGPRIHGLLAAQPNPGHRALAALERAGHLTAVVTQNIDTLHSRAGSRDVIEVHGSIATSSCTTCGSSYPLESVGEIFDNDGVATCACCMGKVKPDVVLFGELLPAEPMAEAERLCAGADLLLCIGSSLEVHPVAGLPELTLAGGGKVAIVTQGPTGYDGEAALKLDGDVVEELGAVLAAL